LKYIIAIDSGATKSEALIFPLLKGESPAVAGRRGIQYNVPPLFKWNIPSLAGGGKTEGRGIQRFSFPPINFNLLGAEKTAKRLIDIIKKASARVKLENVSCICVGISGAGFEKDRLKLERKISKALDFKNIKIYPDTEIALALIFEPNEKNCGILIAGTGSILYYRDSKGKLNKIGGWGRHIGDEGSGYWIAREALYKVTQCYDGRIKNTSLLKVLQRDFKIHPGNIVREVYHNNFEISVITKHVFKEATKGDAVSKAIIKNAAENLLMHFTPLGKKVKYKIALFGSLFSEEKLLEKYLKQMAKQSYPNIELIKSNMRPVWGAVKLAVTLLRPRVLGGSNLIDTKS
jgi:N-acetylglucosamine kinase-like BadF-type ATPase